jgi:citrate synthase
MGHRVYRNNDPRALIFEDMLTQLTSPQEVDSDLIWLRQIEYTVRSVFKKTNKAIYPNVDFWSGSVYKHIGIEPILYPSVFAVSRVVGWLAHILELRQKNRLYRPESLYIGSLDKPYVMIYEREGNALKTKCPSAPNGTLS